jgi:Xaa-Pro aminopeptidase
MSLDAGFDNRLTRLRAEMSERNVPYLWIEPPIPFRYLTGLEPISMERLTGLIVGSDGHLGLVVPEMLAEECSAIEASVHTWNDQQGAADATRAALANVDRLFIQPSLPAWAWVALRDAAPRSSIEIDPGVLSRLREIKDENEVDALRRSAHATDAVAAWIAEQDLTGVTERQLSGRIRARYLEEGLEATPPLVASGANASMPHYLGADEPIAKDEPLLCDFGCSLDGYWSDITRVFFPDGNRRFDDLYDVVCAANAAALAAVKPGVPCDAIDRAARSVIADAGYGDLFVHRTGHGIGLELHEAPYLREGSAALLEVGNVFSIEPGIYMPGEIGLRFENIVYLGPNGTEVLNQAPRRMTFGR